MNRALLFALAACTSKPAPAPTCAPCPYTIVTERKVPDVTRAIYIHCGDYGPPQPPHLDTCTDPLDLYTAGSCANLNRAKRLDYATQLEGWTDYITAVCGLLDKPAWGSR